MIASERKREREREAILTKKTARKTKTSDDTKLSERRHDNIEATARDNCLNYLILCSLYTVFVSLDCILALSYRTKARIATN